MERSKNKFFERLLHPRYKGWWCYAHNGSGYDFRFLIAWLCKNNIPWSAFCAGSRLFLEVEGRQVLDSYAVLPMSLAEAAKKFAVSHQKHEVPEDFYRRIEHYDWQTYLVGDLEALYDCITILRQATQALGVTLKRTLASTAIELWQRHYLDGEYPVADGNDPVEAIARESYAGGRCEVFRPTIGEGESWDINSSYPAAMLAPLPVTPKGVENTDEIPDYGLVFAQYSIPRAEWIPPLYLRTRWRLFHPTGNFSGWRTAEEARYLVQLYGADAVRVSRAAPFAAHPIFESFVQALYEKRLKPGPIGHVAKRLLNSAYGRLGMRREREQIKCGPLPNHPVQRMYDEQRGIYSDRAKRLTLSSTIIPAAAATITARGRIALHKLLRQAPEAAYCDTDNVVTGGKLPVQASTDLGGVKQELHVVSGKFVAPKAYHIVAKEGNRYRVKGLSLKDLGLLDLYLSGCGVSVGHVPGIRESFNTALDTERPAYWQWRSNSATGNRHPDGRPYDTSELT